MISANSKNNRHIRLTDERISHILKNHPEINKCVFLMIETIENPDFISAGDYGELIAVRKYETSMAGNITKGDV
jgi:hypothetical protein